VRRGGTPGPAAARTGSCLFWSPLARIFPRLGMSGETGSTTRPSPPIFPEWARLPPGTQPCACSRLIGTLNLRRISRWKEPPDLSQFCRSLPPCRSAPRVP
jgi:hypothetical protein